MLYSVINQAPANISIFNCYDYQNFMENYLPVVMCC